MEPASVQTFGLLLKRSRRAAQLTQAELAERAGFSTDYISKLERGARHPQGTTVALLADALALAPSERAALESAALPLRVEREALAPQLPTGGFLGAIPLGPLVGREAELARVGAALEAVASGQGRLLVLIGEPGVGKTRLAQEITMLSRAQGFRIITGRCYEPQQGVAYFPFLEALTVAAGVGGETFSALSAQWPEVARLLPDYPANTQTPPQIDDRTAQRRLFWQVTGFLCAQADQAPLALLLDDLHWADGASVDLLQHLSRHTRDRRILLVATYRDLEVNRSFAAALNDLSRDEIIERIAVCPLPAEETTAVIGATLGAGEGAEAGVASVSAQLAQFIQQRSEGNAFFIRQLARAFQEQGEVALSAGQWRLTADTLASAAVPPESIRSVITQRLSRLTAHAQEVLREASVLGQVVRFDDLQHLSHRGELEVEEALAEAAAAGIVREGEYDQYHLNHALTRDTLYAELSARKKRRLHRAAADAIETAPNHERRAAALVYHLLAAEEWGRALPYALLAGDQALALYAGNEAEQQYRRALTLARELSDVRSEAAALERLGNVLTVVGKDIEALSALERAFERYQALEDIEGQGRALALTRAAYVHTGAVEQGLARLEPQAETLSRRGLSTQGQASLHVAVALLHLVASHLDQGAVWAERAVVLARASDDKLGLAEALTRHAASAMDRGHAMAAAPILQEALHLAEDLGDPYTTSDVALQLARAFLESGRFAQGWPIVERALSLAEQAGALAHAALVRHKRASFAFGLGQWDRARSDWEEAAAVARKLGAAWLLAGTLWRLAHLHLYTGDEQAERAIEEARAIGAKTRPVEILVSLAFARAEADLLAGRALEARGRLLSPDAPIDYEVYWCDPQSGCLPPLAWMYAETGADDEAEEITQRILATPVGESSWLLRVGALGVAALLAKKRGAWAYAEQSLEEALRFCALMPYPYGEIKVLFEYGRLFVARGDAAAAQERFTQALAICDRLGEGLYRTYIEQALAGLAADGVPQATWEERDRSRRGSQ